MTRLQLELITVGALALCMWALTVPPPAAKDAPALRPAHSEPRRLMQGAPDGVAWKPQDPFDLSGPMPGDAEVKSAITRGIDFLLERQRADGAWDEQLTGTMLSVVAAQALDAVSLTALCGMALRAHGGRDKRMDAALDKAVSFILAQVFRGKLPLKVYYANWRYTYGLQFLVGEFQAGTARKPEIKAAMRRMVNALLQMQLSNGEANLLDKAKAARIDANVQFKRVPGNLGLALAVPSDGDYRGGAQVMEVLEGGAAAAAGVKAQDRVIECEGVHIENALDYYTLEQDFLRGQTIALKLLRAGKFLDVQCTIEKVWPAYFGMEVGGGKGPSTEVVQFLGLSPAEKAGLKVGDVITALDDAPISSSAEFYGRLAAIKEDTKVKFSFTREGKAMTLDVEAVRAPEADLAIYLAAEDVALDEGILVGDSVVRPQPGPVVPGPGGAALGMKPGDRVCKINGIPVFAIELFEGQCAAFPAGVPLRVEWLHQGVRKSGTLVPRARKLPGSLGVVLDINEPHDPPVVKALVPDGPAALAGIRPGDTIMDINGISVPTHVFFARVMARFYAGEEVMVNVSRGRNIISGRIRLGKANAAFTDVEEGGWSYYPDLGESMSFSTAAALLTLYDTAAATKIVAPKAALQAAENLVDSLRVEDPSRPGVFSYHYRRSLQTKDLGGYNSDVRGSLGRLALCELCLLRAKRRTPAEVEKSLRTWMDLRGELDRVRDYPYTHLTQLWNNAAYYWLFGHWYAMKAAREVGGKVCESMNEIVVKALMVKREKDGTWLHHESFGKTCGTAMALLALGETQGGWRK
ncbi:MAG: PDZ domain-containing protein [Planctomycetes bacterium]|nr:PDZ domain-containing protein [Planctomycetota bacterium]